MAKKFMLEKYFKMQETNAPRTSYDNTSPPTFQESELVSNYADIMSDYNTLVIHNSILKYKYNNLIRENTQLQDKLKKKMYCDSMHWEIIEEIKFCEWLYDKENGIDICVSKLTNKRKSSEGITVTHTQTHTQQSKKVKVTSSIAIPIPIQSTPPPTPFIQPYQKTEKKEKVKDVIVIYDTDETETDDEFNNETGFRKSSAQNRI